MQIPTNIDHLPLYHFKGHDTCYCLHQHHFRNVKEVRVIVVKDIVANGLQYGYARTVSEIICYV